MTRAHEEVGWGNERVSLVSDNTTEAYEDELSPIFSRRMGVAAVTFLSAAQYERPVKVARNGRPLADLHNEYMALRQEQGMSASHGNILEFELAPGIIGYNCSQAFEQIVENGEGNLEARWYIAVRAEIEGTEISRVSFYYQPKDATSTPPNDGLWVLDSKRQLDYESMLFVDDEVPWKPDAEIPFLRPDLKNAGTDTPFAFDRGYETSTTPEAHQDPSVAIGSMNGEQLLVMTAVKARSLRPLASAPNEKRMPYYQEFFIGRSIDTMEKIATGPAHRKGTRIVYLGDSKWGVFNRPQGEYRPGVITYTEFTAMTQEEFIEEFQKAILDVSTVIPDLCQPDEWVGPNFAWPLKDGKIGVIGHLAAMLNKATGEREYSAMSFVYDPSTNTTKEMKVIATKAAFEDLGVGRRIDRDDLDNVIYPGGAVVLPNGKIRLYCGVSDLKAGYIDIDDPFADYRIDEM